MQPSEADRKDEEDGFVRGYHDIPLDKELEQMSFVQLASLLTSCEKDSPKFIVVERELKKHLAKDQAKINRFNIGFGACVGGIFGLVGVILGANLKNSPSTQQVAPSATVQQMENHHLAPEPQIGNIAPRTPPVAQPANHPSPVQNNGQASHNP